MLIIIPPSHIFYPAYGWLDKVYGWFFWLAVKVCKPTFSAKNSANKQYGLK